MLFCPSLGPANGEVMAETLVQYKDHGVKELTDTTFEHLTQVSRFGSGMVIPDPTVFHPGSEFFPSWIRIKALKYFNPKKRL
jgi:hypothetical protein